jgi:hypothetical protein
MNDKKKNALEGEGSYSGTRRYNAGLAKHVRSADVAKLGRKAAEALDSAQGAELRQAEKRGKAGPRAARRARPAAPARSRAAQR